MKIILTGISAELFKTAEVKITKEVSSVSELRNHLFSLEPKLSDHHTAFAVNSVLAKDSDRLKKEDRIMVFHPFSGG
ncbi:MAG: MoaD/ThiS family protein [Bacteroidota bacterium]